MPDRYQPLRDAIAAGTVQLPEWFDCKVAVERGDATALQRFIHDYDDADPERSKAFFAMLRAVLDEARPDPDTIAALLKERGQLQDVLLRNGFTRCDIAACNCGSWHHRYGLPERFAEIKEALADAGHPLANENGNLVIRALGGLVQERDDWRRQAHYETDIAQAAVDEIARLKAELRRIADTDPVDAALDSQRAVRIARAALADGGTK